MARQLKDQVQHAQKNVALLKGHATTLASLHIALPMQLGHHFDLSGVSNAKLLHR